jgi:inorganic pyrophosphatase
MRRHTRVVDRVMPASLGGYPVNYGFVPQTISYDGDPFDGLVLGDPQPGGALTRGVIVGLMQMEDDKGLDSKVVVSPIGPPGAATIQLGADDRRRIAEFFRRYKDHEPGKFSRVPGWSGHDQGRQFVEMTHRFFRDCRTTVGRPCRIGASLH